MRCIQNLLLSRWEDCFKCLEAHSDLFCRLWKHSRRLMRTLRLNLSLVKPVTLTRLSLSETTATWWLVVTSATLPEPYWAYTTAAPAPCSSVNPCDTTASTRTIGEDALELYRLELCATAVVAAPTATGCNAARQTCTSIPT